MGRTSLSQSPWPSGSSLRAAGAWSPLLRRPRGEQTPGTLSLRHPQEGHAGCPLPPTRRAGLPGKLLDATQLGSHLPGKVPQTHPSLTRTPLSQLGTPALQGTTLHPAGTALPVTPVAHRTGYLGTRLSCRVPAGPAPYGPERGSRTRLGGNLRAGEELGGFGNYPHCAPLGPGPAEWSPGEARCGSGFSSHSFCSQGLPPRVECDALPSHPPHSATQACTAHAPSASSWLAPSHLSEALYPVDPSSPVSWAVTCHIRTRQTSSKPVRDTPLQRLQLSLRTAFSEPRALCPARCRSDSDTCPEQSLSLPLRAYRLAGPQTENTPRQA